MSNEKAWAISTAVILVTLALVLAIIVQTVSAASTEREEVCVKAGGSYTKVPNDTKMQCEMP